MSWIIGRHGWVLPWVVFLIVLSTTTVLDRQWGEQQEARRSAAESRAQEQVSVLAEALGRVVAERIGALAVPKLRFTPESDSIGRQAFAASVDSVKFEMTGLQAISVVGIDGTVSAGRDALLGRTGLDPLADSVVRDPFVRALQRGEPTATGVVVAFGSRRVILFDPILPPEPGIPVAVLAAELDPAALYVEARNSIPDSLQTGLFSLTGPQGVQISFSQASADWPTVPRSVVVADTEWTLRLSYPPMENAAWAGLRIATWITGLAVAAALAGILAILRKTIRGQREEISRREEAERRARAAAAEARGLSAQLSAAHTAAQRLSTSLDPEYVLEFFLGTVAEVLGADTASLYTFDEEGDLLGRSRLILRDVGPATERLRGEDIRAVRVPAALVPQLADAVSSGEPQVVEDASKDRDAASVSQAVESAASWVTIPLQVGGNMVGVANWEVYGQARAFDAKDVAFAEALGAQAAAALRTAELYASLESASARATWEASRFGAVLDQMEDGVVIVDAQGRVERHNAAAAELLGSPPASGDVREWVSRLDLVGTDRRSFPLDDFPIQRALQGENALRVNVVARSVVMEDRHLSVSATPIVSDGRGSGAAMIVRDATDEQQYAELLRHTNQELRKHAALLEETNEQLRAATHAKDQFLAVVSHELRTPVNAIMGYAELLDLEIKGTLNDDQKGMLRRLRTTAWHLLGLIDEILDLPKVASGQIELKLEPVEVRDILEAAQQQVEPIAGGKGLELNVEHGEPDGGDGTLVAWADRRRLTQVVLNLLSNAIKFTEQGSVTLLSRSADEGYVELCVRDTGQGIPSDQHERIFDPFYQVESGLTRRAGGTGLGLAITRNFVRLMGGDVTVQSRLGEGAEFVVRIPAAQRTLAGGQVAD